MNAWDLTITLRHETGAIARLGEEFGKAKVNIEGLAIFENNGTVVAHLLVERRELARPVLETLGCRVESERQVVVERIENTAGSLGLWSRHIAEAGVNLSCLYTVMDGRVVFGAEDFAALETAVREMPVVAGARR